VDLAIRHQQAHLKEIMAVQRLDWLQIMALVVVVELLLPVQMGQPQQAATVEMVLLVA
jgi:thiosulfate reductase cytochrome b subunit